MAFFVYILESETTGGIYIAQTSDLDRRLAEHNNPQVGKHRYTRKQKGPWRLIYSEEKKSRSEAMKRERFLKGGQGREWIYKEIIPR